MDGGGSVVFEASYDVYHRAIFYQESGVLAKMSYSLKDRTMETATEKVRTHNRFDSSYRLTECMDSLNRQIKLSYDLRNGKVSSLNDSFGNEYVNEYDSNGRLIRTINPVGSQHRFWYYSDGRLGAILDPLGRGTVYQYDLHGHVAKILDGASLIKDDPDKWEFTCPLTCFSEFTYDPETGLLESVSRSGHLVRKFFYNLRGQLIACIEPSGYVLSRSYDDRGRVEKLYDSQGELMSYSYDDRDRLLKAAFPAGKVEYFYDKSGHISEIRDANGHTTLFTHDEMGNLVEVEDAEGGITRYEHNSSGKVIRIIFPNGTEKIFLYDSLNRVSAA